MKNQSIIISLLLLLGLNLAAAQQAILDSNTLSDRIDTYLTNSAANGYAASVLVAKDDKIILSKGYGWANREYKIPNSPATVFNIGSVTKQFTAAAIIKLVEQGKLKVSDKLPQFFDTRQKTKKASASINYLPIPQAFRLQKLDLDMMKLANKSF